MFLATSDPDASPFATQLTYSATIVWVLERLKQCPRLSWINSNSDSVNRTLAVIGAFVAAVGVHYTLNGTLVGGSTITLVIPPASLLLSGLGHWFQSFVIQESVYRVATKGNPPYVKPAPLVKAVGQ